MEAVDGQEVAGQAELARNFPTYSMSLAFRSLVRKQAKEQPLGPLWPLRLSGDEIKRTLVGPSRALGSLHTMSNKT